MKEEELDVELPGDDDENVGDGIPKKKKEKKKKSREERAAERKVIFWTLLIVMLVTFLFWLFPRLGGVSVGMPEINIDIPKVDMPKPEMRNYVEYKL